MRTWTAPGAFALALFVSACGGKAPSRPACGTGCPAGQTCDVAAGRCVGTPRATSITVAPAAVPLMPGGAAALTATLARSDGSRTDITATGAWSTTDASIAAVDKGHVAAKALGSARIHCSAEGLDGYAAVTVAWKPVSSLALAPLDPATPVGLDRQFTATVTFADGTSQDVTSATQWASSDPSVATLDGATPGLFHALASGHDTISADFQGVTAQTTLTVSAAAPVALAVSPGTLTVIPGLTGALHADATLSDGTHADVTSSAAWTSSDGGLATVDANGIVHGVASGSVTVTAAYAGFSDAAQVTVSSVSLSSIAVAPAAVSLPLGLTRQLTATGQLSDGSSVDLTGVANWSSSSPGTAAVSASGLVTTILKGPGVVITAALDGVSGAATVDVVDPVMTALSVAPKTLALAKGDTAQLQALADLSDGTRTDISTSVVWSTSNAGVLTVSNTGSLVANAQGSAVVTADAGNGFYDTALVDVGPPRLVGLLLSPSSLSLPKGLSAQVTATGLFGDGTQADVTAVLSWTSADPSIATVSAGAVAAAAVGSTTVTADGGNGVTALLTVDVTPAQLVSLTASPNPLSLPKGASYQASATGHYTDGSTQDLTAQVTWSTDAPGVATVSGGNVTAVAQGTANVTADTGAGFSDAIAVTVGPAALTGIAIAPASATIAAGQSQTFSAVASYTDGSQRDVTADPAAAWSALPAAVAAVTSPGVVKGQSAGSATVSVAYGAFAASAGLTVTPPAVVSVDVTPASSSLPAGRSQQMFAVAVFTDASRLDVTATATWDTADPTIATVSNQAFSQGVVTGVAMGDTSVRATYGGVTGFAALHVSDAVLTSLTVSPSSVSLPNGTGSQLTAQGVFSDGTTRDLTQSVSWSSTDQTVAVVSNAAGSQGFVNAVGLGSATVVAADSTSSFTATSAVTVTSATLDHVEVTPILPSTPAGTTLQMTCTGVYTDGTTLDLTSSAAWTSSDGTVAAFAGAAGLVSALANGTATLTAAVTVGAATYSDFTTLAVSPAVLQSISVTPQNAAVAKGFTLQFTATGSYSDGSTVDLTTQVTWASSDASVASISNGLGQPAGLASALAPGAVTVSATDPATALSASTPLTVTTAALVSVAVSGPYASLPVKLSEQLQAVGTFSDNSTRNLTTAVTWSSSNTLVATVSNAAGSQGVLTAVGAGTATVTALDPASGVSGAFNVTVTNAKIVSISVTPNPATLRVAQRQQFVAFGTYNDGTTYIVTSICRWSSNNRAVAVVSNQGATKGLATGKAVGSAQIRAASGSVSGFAVLDVTN